MYTEIWSVVEGAEDRFKSVEGDGYEEALALAQDLRAVSAVEGQYDWEVYVLRHDHADGIDCECVQYLTDHRPMFSSESVTSL